MRRSILQFTLLACTASEKRAEEVAEAIEVIRIAVELEADAAWPPGSRGVAGEPREWISTCRTRGRPQARTDFKGHPGRHRGWHQDAIRQGRVRQHRGGHRHA